MVFNWAGMACSNFNCCSVTPMKSGMVISGIRGMGNASAVLEFGAEAETFLAALGALLAVFAVCSFSAEQALKASMHSVQIHVFE